MKKYSDKPSPEAKALSLFLMAYKTIDPIYKERLKWINKSFDLVKKGQISREKYDEDVLEMLESHGGYSEVVEKTVSYYIEKTGAWTLKGEDKYCEDAQKIADKILKE